MIKIRKTIGFLIKNLLFNNKQVNKHIKVMEITLKRTVFTEESTVGEILINGVFQCFCIEDKDRGLTQSMPLTEVTSKKIYGVTAIPYGRYEVAITFSNRMQKYLPILIGVPAFDGIRIHGGNTAADSLGCILPGNKKSANMVSESKLAFADLFAKMKAVEKKEKIYITITK